MTMNYNDAIKYIHSVSNFFCKPGLERIGELCKKLGNPQNSLKFIHVAGTNGKGSLCSMLGSILTRAGYKTGLYTSPYILNFNERIQIDGKQIDNQSVAKITQRVKAIAEQMEDSPTEFELITAIAFQYFKEQACDIVVLECGLGGRFDATNIISTPVLSVITSISLDHTSFLGNTVREIAKEKAGIIKKGIPCLLCNKHESYFDVIKKCCDAQNAPLYVADKINLNIIQHSLEKTVFNFGEMKNIELSLLGGYQPDNAANAIIASNILRDNAFNIKESHIREGLKSTRWPARFEVINREPLMIFDGGHNEEGVTAAVDSIKLYLGDTKINVVTGVMKDKDYKFIAKKISEVASSVCCITPDNPRALSAEDYAKEFNTLGVSATDYPCVSKAIEFSLSLDSPTVILGSLYMYSQVIKEIKDRF